jgi:hypothetical protein
MDTGEVMMGLLRKTGMVLNATPDGLGPVCHLLITAVAPETLKRSLPRHLPVHHSSPCLLASDLKKLSITLQAPCLRIIFCFYFKFY